ncbi:siderophore ABC transporter substrate-binding protein [Donghicola eburneus]|uniref:Iron ABC transporter substrate-binding protein IsdE n=1 Tax=Donghicola eburneus TaxID=393278 RepID=A0A1M4MY63_9RHOB|nr:siderophore ABC transporter substrate-binding protein [Donghicola eburneus]SCM67530.1 iron ABC transporter substrate-binding protein IsdE [Donghicola eburneus]SFQ06631.1 iron complex transport system substrate-binding protein [Donghicola eburneus]
MKPLFAVLAMTALPVSAIAETVEIDTATGPQAAPLNPAKVVALDLSAIDTLDALGVEIDGIPNITPPAYLADAFDGVATVGTLFEPDFEALAVMAPDVVFAGGRSQTVIPALAEVAPTLDMTIDATKLIDDAKSRITAYGAIFGLSPEAQALTQELEAALADAKAMAEGKGDALILMTNGGKVSAYGDKSRFGWLHTAVGIPEAYPDVADGRHGEAVSFEFIADVDPDWIFVVDRSAAIGQEAEAAAVTLDNPLVAGTKAGQNGQIVYLDSAPLYLAGGGVQSLNHTLSEIMTALRDSNS